MELNKSRDEVETYDNSTGVISQIFVVEVPDKTEYVLNDKTVLFMDLRDSNNDKLPADTQVLLAGKDVIPILADDIQELNYNPYFNLSLQDQLNADNQNSLKINLDQPRIDFEEKKEISVWIDSSVQIDWSNSQIIFNVDQKPM